MHPDGQRTIVSQWHPAPPRGARWTPVRTERRSKVKADVWGSIASIFVLMHKREHIFKVEEVRLVKLMTSAAEPYFQTGSLIVKVWAIIVVTSWVGLHLKFSYFHCYVQNVCFLMFFIWGLTIFTAFLHFLNLKCKLFTHKLSDFLYVFNHLLYQSTVLLV